MGLTRALVSYRWVALALAFACQMSNALASQSIPPLAPLFQPELGLSNAQVGLFSSATFLGAWGILFAAGWLIDRFGVRKVMSAGVIATGLLMLTMTAVTSFLHAVAIMFLVGFGRGTVPPGATKVVIEWFPPTSRATAMGIKLAGMPVAGMTTAALLPTIALALGWRQAMATVGFAIIAAGIANAVLYRGGPQAGKGSVGMPGDLRDLIRDYRIWSLSAVSLVFMAAQMGLLTYLVLYLQRDVLKTSIPDDAGRIVAAGGYLALCQMGGVFGRVFWGVVSDRLLHGRRITLMAWVGALAAFALTLLAFLASDSPSWLLAALVFICGATAVGWNGLLQSAVCEATGQRLAASATGFSQTISQVGLVGGPPLFGLIVDLTGSYQPAWLFSAFLAAVGTVVAMFCARGEKRITGPHSPFRGLAS